MENLFDALKVTDGGSSAGGGSSQQQGGSDKELQAVLMGGRGSGIGWSSTQPSPTSRLTSLSALKMRKMRACGSRVFGPGCSTAGGPSLVVEVVGSFDLVWEV